MHKIILFYSSYFKKYKYSFVGFSLLLFLTHTLFIPSNALAKIVRYELTATNDPANLSGKKEVTFALSLNHSIPAPVLEFTEGDEAEILVHNEISAQELSIHWHGILLPPDMDGVPYVTTPPIKSGKSFLFKFKLRQHGTYWYHSHTNVQEQKGIYGAIVIHPKQEKISYNKDLVLVLSDWSDEDALQILSNLRKDGDYYLYKKNTIRSLLGAIQNNGIKNYFNDELSRMGGMDVSDVGYDAFLINGKKEISYLNFVPGEKIRIRIINAAASSYFYIALGNSPLKIISADGVNIKPIYGKELLIAMAETYDLLWEVPNNKSIEFKITAQDGTGSASAWIGKGEKVFAPIRTPVNLYASMHGHGEHAHSTHNHSSHHMHHDHHSNAVKEVIGVDDIESTNATNYSQYKNIHELKLVLGGDMHRYVWHINGKAIHEERAIEIHENDLIRFTLDNQTMMNHPMHLHGHFFRVLTDKQNFSPLKHTVDVAPHSTRTIEFLANEPGEWMLHCHNLYHLKNGMARVIKYSSFTPSKEIKNLQKHDPHLHEHIYFYDKIKIASNFSENYFRATRTWDQIDIRSEAKNTAKKLFSFSKKWEWENDFFYRRWFAFDNFFNVMGGFIHFDEKINAAIGIGYTLPLLIRTNLIADHRGKIRIDLEKNIQWSKNFLSEIEFMWRPNYRNHKYELKTSLLYAPAWRWSGGIYFTDDSVGAGAQFQF